MTKAKTNALDALRALIAERQQYEQWVSVLDSKREGTPPHVFEKVNADYESRLDRVVGDIAGYAEELQLSITTLSSRLIEVAREEDTRRDTLQEAELRAAVGEYEPARWEDMRTEAQRELDRIATDREHLDSELAELRSIQTLSAVGARQPKDEVSAPAPDVAREAAPAKDSEETRAPEETHEPAAAADSPAAPAAVDDVSDGVRHAEANAAEPPRTDTAPIQRELVVTPGAPVVGNGSIAPAATPARVKSMKTPAGGTMAKPARPAAEARADQSKTLKCPECGTPNHPTEWYCERCGGELATM